MFLFIHCAQLQPEGGVGLSFPAREQTLTAPLGSQVRPSLHTDGPSGSGGHPIHNCEFHTYVERACSHHLEVLVLKFRLTACSSDSDPAACGWRFSQMRG